MNPFKLVGAFIRRRPLTWGFHALTLALGVAVLSAVLAFERRTVGTVLARPWRHRSRCGRQG